MPRQISRFRHWKQRFDPTAKFIWRKPVQWGGEQMVPGELCPDTLLTNKGKLQSLWGANVIELAEFEPPPHYHIRPDPQEAAPEGAEPPQDGEQPEDTGEGEKDALEGAEPPQDGEQGEDTGEGEKDAPEGAEPPLDATMPPLIPGEDDAEPERAPSGQPGGGLPGPEDPETGAGHRGEPEGNDPGGHGLGAGELGAGDRPPVPSERGEANKRGGRRNRKAGKAGRR